MGSLFLSPGASAASASRSRRAGASARHRPCRRTSRSPRRSVRRSPGEGGPAARPALVFCVGLDLVLVIAEDRVEHVLEHAIRHLAEILGVQFERLDDGLVVGLFLALDVPALEVLEEALA